MKSKSDPRHAARKIAVSSIFCWLFSEPEEAETQKMAQELYEETEADKELLEFLIQGVKANKNEIDKIIQECAPDWPLDKVAKVDLVILRIAVFEILYSDKTPAKVAIDEAVELAKEFGNDTSSKFINGVLGTVAEIKERKKNG